MKRTSAKKRREHTRQSLLLKDLLSERRELRQEEKNGPHFGMMSEPEGDAPQEDLDKQIADDPYVKEGIHLLDDMKGFAG